MQTVLGFSQFTSIHMSVFWYIDYLSGPIVYNTNLRFSSSATSLLSDRLPVTEQLPFNPTIRCKVVLKYNNTHPHVAAPMT